MISKYLASYCHCCCMKKCSILHFLISILVSSFLVLGLAGQAMHAHSIYTWCNCMSTGYTCGAIAFLNGSVTHTNT